MRLRTRTGIEQVWALVLWLSNAYLGADVALMSILLCGEMKARRAINSIAIEQSHRRHLQLESGGNQLFRHRSAFQKTKSRPRM